MELNSLLTLYHSLNRVNVSDLHLKHFRQELDETRERPSVNPFITLKETRESFFWQYKIQPGENWRPSEN